MGKSKYIFVAINQKITGSNISKGVIIYPQHYILNNPAGIYV